jgi:hypothetical protein
LVIQVSLIHADHCAIQYWAVVMIRPARELIPGLIPEKSVETD